MGDLSFNGSSKQTDLPEFYDLSSSIDKVSFKSNSMSLVLVLLEEKLFTRMWTPQSDAIMSADIKISLMNINYIILVLNTHIILASLFMIFSLYVSFETFPIISHILLSIFTSLEFETIVKFH